MPQLASTESVSAVELACNCQARLAAPIPTTEIIHRRLIRVRPSREPTVQKERALRVPRDGLSREARSWIPLLSTGIPMAAWPREPLATPGGGELTQTQP